MRLDESPSAFSQSHNSNSPARKILLVVKILVGGQEHLETRRFGCAKQFSIFQLVPPACPRLRNGVALNQEPGKRSRRAIVEQNEHLGASDLSLSAMGDKLQNSRYLFARDAEFGD